MANRIVVGVDGSPAAQAALDFAVAEAALRGSSVQALDRVLLRPAAARPGEQ